MVRPIPWVARTTPPLRGGKGEVFEGGIRVVASMRWPERLEAGTRMDQIMTVMDVFPTLMEAVDIAPGAHRNWDGSSLWSSITEGAEAPRTDYVFFASETPIYGMFNLTLFNQDWKLVQELVQNQTETSVTNYLFDVGNDPNEYENLVEVHPDKVAEMDRIIHQWRATYPVYGTRSYLTGPPGWRAPKDWATFPRSVETLQEHPAPGMMPPGIEKLLDAMHGERGRLIDACESQWPLEDVCK